MDLGLQHRSEGKKKKTTEERGNIVNIRPDREKSSAKKAGSKGKKRGKTLEKGVRKEREYLSRQRIRNYWDAIEKKKRRTLEKGRGEGAANGPN